MQSIMFDRRRQNTLHFFLSKEGKRMKCKQPESLLAKNEIQLEQLQEALEITY